MTAARPALSDEKRPGEGKLSMLDKLDLMVRFWRLKARNEARGKPLSGFERVELLSLLQLMAADQNLPEAGPAPKTEQGFPLQVMVAGGFQSGELRLICPDGIVIASKTPLTPGQRTIARLVDAIAGVEYALPCVVVWCYRGAAESIFASAALRIDGLPTRTTFSMPELSVWRPSQMTAPRES
ncbi:MAG: hypothetical protein HUU21_26710 [Polyangiaceae bacterium]|nr:hypothetical protein [Polyangiaceae bacterium]NUQ77143.1 hypothetical protein [Polyangiaceae bacterium]